METAAAGGAPPSVSQREIDIQVMLEADVHLGTKNSDFQMELYDFKRRSNMLSDEGDSSRPPERNLGLDQLLMPPPRVSHAASVLQ